MFARLADLALSRPRRSVLIAALVFVVVAVLGAPAPGKLDVTRAFDDPGSESTHARQQIERATGEGADPGAIALVRAPRGSREVQQVATIMRTDPGVARVTVPPPSGPSPLVSSDGSQTLVAATFHARARERDVAKRLDAALAGDPVVSLGGNAVAQEQVNKQATHDLGTAELIAFPILALLSLLIFRGVAAMLPLAVGALTVLGTFALLRAVNVGLALSPFALNLVIGMGLGLGVDYSLFLVSRFREELGKGSDLPAAVRATVSHAGRTVALQRAHGRRRRWLPGRVPAALPHLDGRRRRAHRAGGGRGVSAPSASAVRAAGFAARQGRARARARRALVPLRLRRDAPAGDRGRGRGGAAARDRDSRPGLHWTGVDAKILPQSERAGGGDAIERGIPGARRAPINMAVTRRPGARAGWPAMPSPPRRGRRAAVGPRANRRRHLADRRAHRQAPQSARSAQRAVAAWPRCEASTRWRSAGTAAASMTSERRSSRSCRRPGNPRRHDARCCGR